MTPQHEHELHTMAQGVAKAQALVPFYVIHTKGVELPGRTPKDQAIKAWNRACMLADHPECKL